MIPIVHQSRAGPPTATTGVRAVEAVSTPLVLSDGDGPAVEQGGAASPDVQLGQHGDLAQTPQRQPSVPRRAPPADLDVPHDKLVFRGKVLRFLSAVYGDDGAFQRALQNGTIVIQAVDDQPDPELCPELTYAIYRNGVDHARKETRPPEPRPHRGGPPPTVGPQDFIAWWPK